MPKTATEQKFYSVPAGTRMSRCSGSTCGAPMYWVRNPATGRALPIDCDVDGGKRPSESKDVGQLDLMGGEAQVYDGRGVSHFETCPDREEFTRHPDARR